MKRGNSTYLFNNYKWFRLRSILLCLLLVVFLLSSTLAVFAETVSDALGDGTETRAQIKARLLKQIKNNGWDPYSASMTLDEFYALMELFEEGKLPLNSNSNAKAKAAIFADVGVGDGPGIEDPVTPNEPMYIPRQYFFLVGLPDSVIGEDESETEKPLIYNRDYDYEPYDPYTNLRYTVTTDEQTDDEIYKLDVDGSTTEYTLGEDGKLYDTSITSFKQYDHAFRHKGNGQIYTRSADGFDLALYALGTDTPYDYVPKDTDDPNVPDANIFTSVATGKVYVVVEDGGLWEYNEETQQIGAKAFNEAACDYYYIESGEHKQLYQFKDNALYVAGTNTTLDYIKALSYYYPSGYGYDNSGYLRPAKDWKGIEVGKGNQAVIVSEGINKDNYEVSGNVDQSNFIGLATFSGYYVKAVSIGGANINILGMIQSPATGKYVYYYLSAEEQSTQVSTTTLEENDKFIIEYTPNEHEISYQVLMADKFAQKGFSGENITNTPSNVVFYGSNSATTASWVDGIFGTTSQRPAQTTGGAYSFNVTVPYGYEMQIFISVDRAIPGIFKDSNGKDIPDIAKDPANGIPYIFHADVNHTGSRAEAEDTWLTAYGSYLATNGIIDSSLLSNGQFDLARFKTYIKRSPNKDGNDRDYSQPISYEWVGAVAHEDNRTVHNDTLKLIAERVNDMAMHNSARTRDGFDGSQTGYPLGREPLYEYYPGAGFNVYPNDNGPEVLTMNDTFYNHQVRASRVITAVLTAKAEPIFDVRYVIQKSSGADNRGSIASYNNAVNADADYEAYLNGEGSSSPVKHPDNFPNVDTADGWSWTTTTNSKNSPDKGKIADREKYVTMDYNSRTGTYSYSWMFQTNTGANGYFLDAFAVNGSAIAIPMQPKYLWANNQLTENANVSARTPYYTETTLKDGATLRLEFLLEWGYPQRHYRVTVVGARTNVTITGLNLMQGTGAAEFSIYNLVGVYDGVGSQTNDTIQYFSEKSEWKTQYEANIVVSDDSGNGIKHEGDTSKYGYGANIRFKIADGYGNPYFIWAGRNMEPINNQASVALTKDGEIESINDVILLSDVIADDYDGKGALVGGNLSSQYVYYNDIVGSDGYGYYYIKVSKPGDLSEKNRIVFLTIVARTIKYTVRYVPEYVSDYWYGGFLIDPTTNELVVDSEKGFDGRLTKALIKDQGEDKSFDLKYDKNSYPWFEHNPDICVLYEMAKNSQGIVPKDIEAILHQFDDNGGNFYDLLLNNKAGIASNTYGTITPQDSTGSFAFVSWVMVGKDFMPILVDGNPVYFTGGAIDFNIYSDYAVLNEAFGTNDTDVYVIRLMPVWRTISHPYYYNVVLNWIDAKGELNMTNFSNWDKVLTETLEGNVLYVYLNQDADPLKDWIAAHPTYTFWDDVNNAVTAFFDDGNKDVATNSETLKAALAKYLQREFNENNDIDTLLLKALVNRDYTGKREDGTEVEKGEWKRNEKGEWYYTGGNGVDDFDRLGDNIFRVNEDGGTISIWMYENKGGLIFRNEVKGESFIADEEFYYVVQNEGLLRMDGDKEIWEYNVLLSGEYKAYPQPYYNAEKGTWGLYDDKGEFRPVTDNDAWLVTFENGVMISVKKIGSDEEPTPYFKLKDGDGIALYVPEGKYSVVEVGSKSGGGYKAEAEYSGQASSNGTVEFPWKDEGTGEMWLMGNSTTYYDPKDPNVNVPQDVSQVAATVIFMLGEKEVIQTITFYNLTTALSVELSLTKDVYNLLPSNATLNQKQQWEDKYLIGYQVVVVFALPENATPLVKRATDSKTRAAAPGENYFNMNVYWEEDGETKSRSEELVFKEFKYSVDKNEYNIEPSFYEEKIGASNSKNLWVGVFYLQPKETAAITMQVMSDDVNYWIDESLATTTDSNNVTTISDRLDNGLFVDYGGLTGRSGMATEGKKAEAKIINFHVEPKNGFLAISVTGGKATESFVFKVTSQTTGDSVYVTVKGGSIVYIYAPTAEYEVTLIDTWSWRYTVILLAGNYVSTGQKATVTVSGDNNTEDSAAIVYYSATDNNSSWLGGEGSKKQ